MTEILKSVIAAIGIDIGKNWFHVVGLDGRGAIALRQKWSRGQVETRLACLTPPPVREGLARQPFGEVDDGRDYKSADGEQEKDLQEDHCVARTKYASW